MNVVRLRIFISDKQYRYRKNIVGAEELFRPNNVMIFMN